MSINDTNFDFLPDVKAGASSEEVKEPAKAPAKSLSMADLRAFVGKQTRKKPEAKRDDGPPADKPQASAEDEEDQDAVIMNLRMKVNAYLTSERFRDYLKKAGLAPTQAKINKMDETKLKSTLKRIQFAIGNRNSKSLVDGLIQKGIMTGEAVGCKMGARIEGLTQALYMNEQFLDDIEAIRLEYLSFGIVNPPLRVAYSIIATGSQLHIARKTIERQEKRRKARTVPPTTSVGDVSAGDNVALNQDDLNEFLRS